MAMVGIRVSFVVIKSHAQLSFLMVLPAQIRATIYIATVAQWLSGCVAKQRAASGSTTDGSLLSTQTIVSSTIAGYRP